MRPDVKPFVGAFGKDAGCERPKVFPVLDHAIEKWAAYRGGVDRRAGSGCRAPAARTPCGPEEPTMLPSAIMSAASREASLLRRAVRPACLTAARTFRSSNCGPR
jgi:hypothetical protein